MTGRAMTPSRAVKTISTAVSLCRKYLSTRYLSMWVEMAQRIGPEKAKGRDMNYDLPGTALVGRLRPPPPRTRFAREGAAGRSLSLLLRNQNVGDGRARRGTGVDH